MNFSYKSLQLNMSFNVKKQVGRDPISQGTAFIGVTSNISRRYTQLSHWQNPGDVTELGKWTTEPYRENSFTDYAFNSDAGLTDASFIRLQNLHVSFSLPEKFIKKIGIRGCGINLSTSNLFVITRYKRERIQKFSSWAQCLRLKR